MNPGGIHDNSPMLQRWVISPNNPRVPKGRLKPTHLFESNHLMVVLKLMAR